MSSHSLVIKERSQRQNFAKPPRRWTSELSLRTSNCQPICAQLLLENEQMQIERPGSSRAVLNKPLLQQRTRLRMAAEDVAAARQCHFHTCSSQPAVGSHIRCRQIFGNRHRLEQPNEIKKAWVWDGLGTARRLLESFLIG